MPHVDAVRGKPFLFPPYIVANMVHHHGIDGGVSGQYYVCTTCRTVLEKPANRGPAALTFADKHLVGYSPKYLTDMFAMRSLALQALTTVDLRFELQRRYSGSVGHCVPHAIESPLIGERDCMMEMYLPSDDKAKLLTFLKEHLSGTPVIQQFQCVFEFAAGVPAVPYEVIRGIMDCATRRNPLAAQVQPGNRERIAYVASAISQDKVLTQHGTRELLNMGLMKKRAVSQAAVVSTQVDAALLLEHA